MRRKWFNEKEDQNKKEKKHEIVYTCKADSITRKKKNISGAPEYARQCTMNFRI